MITFLLGVFIVLIIGVLASAFCLVANIILDWRRGFTTARAVSLTAFVVLMIFTFLARFFSNNLQNSVVEVEERDEVIQQWVINPEQSIVWRSLAVVEDDEGFRLVNLPEDELVVKIDNERPRLEKREKTTLTNYQWGVLSDSSEKKETYYLVYLTEDMLN